MNRRLAIVTTHPIQYYAPVFQLLAEKISLKVFYTGGEELVDHFDHGFKQKIAWDIPLLTGYSYTFLKNVAAAPGTYHFKGIKNRNALEQITLYKPDAILIYGWAWQSHLNIIKHFGKKLPIYFRGDSTLISKGSGLKNILKTLFLKWLYSHIDTAFYVGSANKAYYLKYGLKENQLIFAPHAIDNDRFSDGDSKLSIRKQFGIADDQILILFAGKLEPVKNPLLLLQAFQEVSLTGVHLLFVGNGLLENELKLMAEAKHLSKVHFLPFQNQTQMPSIYKSCDLFCLPSKSETWGLSVNEAMASGKAILVSDHVGCAKDLVPPNVGEIFKSDDQDDLKQKLIDLTTDKNKLIQMGQNAFSHIQDWSFYHQVKAIATYVNR